MGDSPEPPDPPAPPDPPPDIEMNTSSTRTPGKKRQMEEQEPQASKKIKSDRINALRKQYDSFLEEDKKRKERNEYILGKLDKMAYSTALLPARTKVSQPTTIINRPSAMYHLVYQPETPIPRTVPPSTIIQRQLSPNIPVQKIDDTYLIQEISKDYILIPKLRTPFLSSYLQQTTPICNNDIIKDVPQPISNDNTDWKSKYEILNILKNEEADKQSVQALPKIFSETQMHKETVLNNINEDVITTDDTFSKIDYKNIIELPEKDISDEKNNYKHEINNEVTGSTIIKPESITLVNPDISEVDPVADIDNQLQKSNLEYEYSEVSDTHPVSSDSNYVEQAKYNYTEHIDPTLAGEQISYAEYPTDGDTNYVQNAEYNYTDPIHSTSAGEQVHYPEHFEQVHETQAMTEQNLDNQGIENAYVKYEDGSTYQPDISAETNQSGHPVNQVYIEEQDAESIQVIGASELLEEIYDNPIVADSGIDNYVDYEHSEISIPELTSNNDFQMKSSTDATSEQTVEQTNAGVVDSTHEQQAPTETVAEFQEGEKDDEESAEIVGIQAFDAEQREMFYAEHPVEGYGYEQDDTNTNDQRYQQNEAYNPNLNYYEGSEHQQVYPVEIEDEELTLRYDQSYHQQYVDSYEKAYNQQQPEYENSEAYQPYQSERVDTAYDQQPYENSEQIQSTLDNEEGYTEQEGIITQAEEIKKQDVKQINPEAVS